MAVGVSSVRGSEEQVCEMSVGEPPLPLGVLSTQDNETRPKPPDQGPTRALAVKGFLRLPPTAALDPDPLLRASEPGSILSDGDMWHEGSKCCYAEEATSVCRRFQ
jgi:hypothetical protein